MGNAKKGEVDLYPAKTGTLFCDRVGREGDRPGRMGGERTIAGTRAVVLSFPAQVDPLDTGVSNVERESARIAFVEPTKGLPGVRPGKLYQAGRACTTTSTASTGPQPTRSGKSPASSKAAAATAAATCSCARRCRSARCDDANQAVR